MGGVLAWVQRVPVLASPEHPRLKKIKCTIEKTNFKCRLKLEFYDTFSSGGMFLSIENSIEKTYFSMKIRLKIRLKFDKEKSPLSSFKT